MPMSTPLLIPLGIPGLTKSDLSFRFYRDGVLDQSVISNLTLTPVGSSLSDYKLDNLPDTESSSEQLILTWEYPAGVGFYYIYGQRSIPTFTILPIRESGLLKSDVSLTIYKNGVDQESIASGLTFQELGSLSNPGDYLVSNWPLNIPGHWSLIWRWSGITFSYSWNIPDIQLIGDFITIRGIQDYPIDIGLDPQKRQVYSQNFVCYCNGIPNLEQSILILLQSGGVGTVGQDIFNGSVVDLSGNGIEILVKSSGGYRGQLNHNNERRTYPTFQVLTFGPNNDQTYIKALEVSELLGSKTGVTVEV